MEKEQICKGKELLDDLAAGIGCTYLSDLHYEPIRSDILGWLKRTFPCEYGLTEWTEAIQYILAPKVDYHFSSSQNAYNFLCNELSHGKR